MGDFEGFFNEHRGRLFAYLLRLCGDRMLADDFFQEACMRYLDRYEDGGVSAPLLYTIARNVFIDHTRRRRFRVESEHEVIDECGCDQEQVMLVREEYRGVLDALQRLDAQERDLLALVASGDLSYRQIAEMVGITPGNVKVRVHRARCRLREILKGDSI